MSSAVDNGNRRQRLEDLVRQRIVKKVLSAVHLDPAGAPLAHVHAAVAKRQSARPDAVPYTDRELEHIASVVAAQFPVVAAEPASPRTQRNAASQPHQEAPDPLRSALSFPPLQTFSPRSRTIGAAANTSRFAGHGSQVASYAPVPPSASSGCRPLLTSAAGGAPISSKASTIPLPPTTAPHTARAPRAPFADDDAFDDADGLQSSRRPVRRPARDVWARMAEADQLKWRSEQEAKQRRHREGQQQQRDALRAQQSQREREENEQRSAAEKAEHAAAQHRRRQDDAKEDEQRRRKAQEAKVKEEIARQLEHAASRRVRRKQREHAADVALRNQYEQDVRDDRAAIDAKRLAAYEGHHESLLYNEALEAAKAEAKRQEQERDKEAARVMDAQMAVEEARRRAHREKIQSKALRSQAMAANLQASFEQKAKDAEARAAREAAAAAAAEGERLRAATEARNRQAAEVHRDLERQMLARQREREAEQAREREMRAAFNRDAEAAKTEDLERATRRKQIVAQHRREIEAQIDERNRRLDAPDDLTPAERSMNRQYLQTTSV
jgi:hypothetical protein